MKVNNIYYVIAQSEKDAYTYLMFHLTSSSSSLAHKYMLDAISQLEALKGTSPSYNSYQIYTVVLTVNVERTVI